MPPPPSEGPPKQVEPTDAELAELEDLVRTSDASDVGERPAETQAETVVASRVARARAARISRPANQAAEDETQAHV